MPLTDEQRLEMRTLAAQAELEGVMKWVEKLQALIPVSPDTAPGDRAAFSTAVGVLWYGMLGGMRQRDGESAALRLDLTANVTAGIMLPDLVDLPEAVQRVLDYQQMAEPKARG